MGVTRITLPRLGETMEEARVTDWLKAPGEAFRRGDVLLEVETDKTVVEVPALQDGVLLAQLVAPGDTVALDQEIAEIRVEGGADGSPTPYTPEPVAMPAAEAMRTATVAPPSAPSTGGRVAASPVARRLARGAGLALEQIAGTGRGGRVMGEDVRRALAGRAGAAPGALGVAFRKVAPRGGAGAPILLLHGLFDSGKGWRDLPERLARAGHPVIVPDLPGHGDTARPASSLEDLVDRMAAFAAEVLEPGRVWLVGHSLGAVVAARLAGRLGARVERLALIAPAGLGPRIDPDFLDLMEAAETPAALGRAMARLGGAPLSDALLAGELERLRSARPGLRTLARELAVHGIQQIDLAPVLDGLEVPTVAIFGLEDRIIDWRDAAALPARTAIHLLRGAGHLPQSSDPGLVADLVLGRGRAEHGGEDAHAA